MYIYIYSISFRYISSIVRFVSLLKCIHLTACICNKIQKVIYATTPAIYLALWHQSVCIYAYNLTERNIKEY